MKQSNYNMEKRTPNSCCNILKPTNNEKIYEIILNLKENGKKFKLLKNLLPYITVFLVIQGHLATVLKLLLGALPSKTAEVVKI